MKPVFESFSEYEKKGRETESIQVGDFVACRVLKPGTGTHIVEPLFKSTLSEFSRVYSRVLLVWWNTQVVYSSFGSSSSSSLQERSSPSVMPWKSWR